MFVFVIKIMGYRYDLESIVTCLIDWESQDKDDFYIVVNNIEGNFCPSYSGEDKSKVWNALGVSGIDWPPKIYNLKGKE